MSIIGCTAYQVQCDVCQVTAPSGLDQDAAKQNATTLGFEDKTLTCGPNVGKIVWICEDCKQLIGA